MTVQTAEEILAGYGKTAASKPKKVHPHICRGMALNTPLVETLVSGDIGIEIEVEGSRLPNSGHLDGIRGAKTGVAWATHRDGSLRGESMEYVLTGPCTKNELDTLVDGLYAKFETYGSALVPSNRCSTHVHINMGGLKVNEITSFISLWMVFEPMLIEYCGELRKTNHFCLSSCECEDTAQAWLGFLRGEVSRHNWRDGLKYSALNILPLNTFGSIEVRTAPLWVEGRRVKDWARFVLALRDYAVATYQNPQSLGYALSERQALDIFESICESDDSLEGFKRDVLSLFPHIHDFNSMGMRGFRNAQPFIFGIPWHDLMEEINKPFIPNPFDKKATKKARTQPAPRRATEGMPFITTDWAGPPPARTVIRTGTEFFLNEAGNVERREER